MKIKSILMSALALFFLASAVEAVQTKITVKVKTKDAKFLGSSMGGAEVMIKDLGTGKVLARGVTEGSTGNTKLIMIKPVERGVPISQGAAQYTATIDIDKPTQVEVSAKGPLSEPHAMNSVSITQWVVPGKHIVRGDALMLDLPGLMVKLLMPSGNAVLTGAPQTVQIGTLVRMM